jgi:pimeloyl-ACP methyl ester carboxylesterase
VSEGAWVAAKYCLEHPDRVATLCLMGSRTICHAMGIFTPNPSPWTFTSDYIRTLLDRQIVDKSAITEELVELRTSLSNLPGVPEALQIYREGRRRLYEDPNLRLKFDMSYTLPRLQIPSLVLWGNQDPSAPLEIVHKLPALLPNMQFHFIDDCGHQMPYDQPQLLLDMLIAFFDKEK